MTAPRTTGVLISHGAVRRFGVKLHRDRDRGEGPLSYLAVILLVAMVTASVTTFAIPARVTGSIEAAVCRIIGNECDGERTASPPGNPPNTTPPGSGSTPGPGAGAPSTDPQYQNALDAYNRANQDAANVENEWASFDLLKELAKLGLDFLFGDIVNCIKDPNLMDCLWGLLDVVPFGKIGKFLKSVPKIAKLAKRFIDLKRRLDKAREARKAARKRLDDIIEACKKRPAHRLSAPTNPHTYHVLAGTNPILVHNGPVDPIPDGDACEVKPPEKVDTRPGPGDKPTKVVNTNMPHSVERAVERKAFPTVQDAREALQNLSRRIEADGFPEGTIKDTAHDDRVLVPLGKDHYAVYQIKKNGNAVLKTVLNKREPGAAD